MAQADQKVENASFPDVRTDINDNLAALFSQNSGNSAPAVTVAFMPWIDTSSSPAVWKVRNAANSGWITVGTIDATTFAVGGLVPIANGGTGQTTAAAALTALLPSQTGNSGKVLTTNGTLAGWGAGGGAAGASIQTFTGSGTYTPTAGKTTFLVLATGGGGGGNTGSTACGGGGGGTAIRFYSSAEMGASATVTVGAGGSASSSGGSTSFTPAGTGPAITGAGGVAGSNAASVSGGGSTNSLFAINGSSGIRFSNSSVSNVALGGASFWAGGQGRGGDFNAAGIAGVVMVLEW